jgi:hypothetical protein
MIDILIEQGSKVARFNLTWLLDGDDINRFLDND